MRTVLALMDRNRKLFFKDKGMLFTSMITPVILIVLYATFLAKVFRDSFTAAIPDVITISDKLINGTVAYRTIRMTGVIIDVNNIPLSLKNSFLFLFINANTVLINAHLQASSL